MGVFKCSPQMDTLVGAWYIDRNRYEILPVLGVHWRPNSPWDFYLVIPNPKIRRKSINQGGSQWWIYFSGEYGGGRWSVDRLEGGDNVDYNDLRAIFGIEWETQTQLRGHVEVGYVFNREIVYAKTNTPTLDLDDSMMIRLGVDF